MQVIFVVSIVVIVAIGLLAYRQAWTFPGGGPSLWGRNAAARFGAVRAALAISIVGTVLVWLVSLPLGFLAKDLTSSVDRPAYNYAFNHADFSKFTALNAKLTVTGNNAEIQLVCLFAVVLFAALWGRNWWVPVAIIPVVFYLERYSQRNIAKVVMRKPPETTAGVFPSGGVARILSVYGVLLLLVLLLLPALSRAWRTGLYTALGLTAAIEAYTRWFLSKHWLTDALGGIIFGYLLLLVFTAAVAALTSAYPPRAWARAEATGSHRAAQQRVPARAEVGSAS
jgi:membrane-associated phospholipid phosphatase